MKGWSRGEVFVERIVDFIEALGHFWMWLDAVLNGF